MGLLVCRQARARAVTSEEAIALVKREGILLESARGPVPNLAESIAGETIRGGWWGHPKGHDIFAATRAVRDSADVLVCRLLDGKVTFIHRRLWPAVVRLAEKLNKTRLSAIRDEHTASGSHRVVESPFPRWVSKETQEAADRLSEKEAVSQVGEQVARALGLAYIPADRQQPQE
jgi:hypothetical protein